MGNSRTAVFNAILVGFAAGFWLKRTDRDLSSFLVAIGYNTGLHGCIGNDCMGDWIVYPFREFRARYNNEDTVRT